MRKSTDEIPEKGEINAKKLYAERNWASNSQSSENNEIGLFSGAEFVGEANPPYPPNVIALDRGLCGSSRYPEAVVGRTCGDGAEEPAVPVAACMAIISVGIIGV